MNTTPPSAPTNHNSVNNKHPSGLSILFLTEMWERFSFYGMRALLILYLVNALEYPREQALQIYATYTALVYLTPIIGGYLADKWLGAHRAVFIGGIIMALGHFAMAIPSQLYTALGLLIVGNGFFKPNISATVGALYNDNDPRRDGGFTIFYMGINLGAFFSPLVCGTLGEKVGWHYGFAAAGVGMLIGLTIYILGQKKIVIISDPNHQGIAGNTPLSTKDWRLCALVTSAVLIAVIAFSHSWQLLSPLWKEQSFFVKAALASIIVATIFVIVKLAKRTHQTEKGLTPAERHRLIGIFIMAVFIVFFWMGFEQAGGTMNLFADQQTNRVVFGWEIPASYFQSINPLVIILLAPGFSLLWTRLDRSRLALTPVIKQAIGMIILGLGFIVLAIAQSQVTTQSLVSPMWLVSVYVLFTLGELCLSPIGLSMVSKLAPTHMVSFIMGLWFTAIAVANYLAGTLEALIQHSDIPLYWFLVGSSIGAGTILLIISPILHRLMGYNDKALYKY